MPILKKLENFLFEVKKEPKMRFILAGVISAVFSAFVIFTGTSNAEKFEDPAETLSVLIPKNHILYPFEASNFDTVEPLLENYNMVRVYDPKSGGLIAKNIKVIRSPSSPDHLAFLLPVNIANNFAEFGLSFKVVIQDITQDEPQFMWAKQPKIKTKKTFVTFGG